MQCSRCKFENMPGLTTCMRCGSVLTAPQGALEVDPPRMAAWKKPFRRLGRGLRRIGIFSPFRAVKVPRWMVLFSTVTFFGVILSIIPGLAHCIQRRFKSIRWWIAAWLILLFWTLFLFGGLLGLLLLGLALAVHVWIALHSSFLKGNNTLPMRIVVFLLALALYYFLYTHMAGLIFHSVTGGYSVVSVPAQQIEIGDYLLGHRSPGDVLHYPRGSIVFVSLRQIGGRRNIFFERSYGGYVQIVGLPGEEMELKEGNFFINQKPLNSNQFPVPQWLQGQKLAVKVPQGSYFISAEFTARGYNEQMAAQALVVSGDQVEGLAFLRWWPIWRRGFIGIYE